MPRRREGPYKNPKNGYYYFNHVIGFGPDRRRVRFSLGTSDKRKAQLLYEQEWKRIWAEYYGLNNRGAAGPLYFSDLIPKFLAHERDIKRVKTWKIMKRRLEIINDVWGETELRKITQEKLVELDDVLKNKYGKAPKTINHYFGLLKTFFNYAIENGFYTGRNPVGLVRPYVTDARRRSFSPDELQLILNAAAHIEAHARSKNDVLAYAQRIIRMLLFTGMRTGEVLNLRWKNIVDNKIRLERTETKQKKEKTIPITPGIRAILDSLPRRNPNELVFPFPEKKIRRGNLRIIKLIRKLSGIHDFDFHSLRHTAATIMVSEALGRGVGLADIMSILGHSRVETTLKYLHENEDRKRRALEIVENMLK